MLHYLVNTLTITQASQDLMLWRVEGMLHYLANTLTIIQYGEVLGRGEGGHCSGHLIQDHVQLLHHAHPGL